MSVLTVLEHYSLGDFASMVRYQVVGDLLRYADQMPLTAGGATTGAAPGGEPTEQQPALPDVAELDRLLQRVVDRLIASAATLSDGGALPPAELLDDLDALNGIAADLGTEPETVDELRAALVTTPVPDPQQEQADLLLTLTGEHDDETLVEAIHGLARDAVGPDASDADRTALDTVHQALTAEPDFAALQGVDAHLQSRGIVALQLLGRAAALRFVAPADEEADATAAAVPTGRDASSLEGGQDAHDVPVPDEHEPPAPAADEPETAEPAPAERKPDPREAPGVEATRPEVVRQPSPERVPPAPREVAPNSPGTPKEPVQASAEAATPQHESLVGEATLAWLVKDDPMLAALLVAADEGPADLTIALKAVALSEVIGEPDGEAARELARLLVAHSEAPDESKVDGPLVAAAAISLALHAPQQTLLTLTQPPAQLQFLPSVPIALQAIVGAVTRGTLSREHVEAAARAADVDATLKDVVRAAKKLLEELPKRDSRHGPAKRTWRALIHKQGELGSMLFAIAEGRATIQQAKTLLSSWDPRDDRLDHVAAEHGADRGRSGRIVSGVRSWLLKLVEEVLAVVEQWLGATLARDAGAPAHGAHRTASFETHRRALVEALDDSTAELGTYLQRSGLQDLERAGLLLLADRLAEARRATDAHWESLVALDPRDLMQATAARAWELSLDLSGRPTGERIEKVDALKLAVGRTLNDTIERRLQRGDVAAAEAALRVAASATSAEEADACAEAVRRSRADQEAALTDTVASLTLESARLLRFGLLPPERHAALLGVLQNDDRVAAGRLDLRKEALAAVRTELDELRQARSTELMEKLDSLTVEPADNARLIELLEAGDFAVVEDHLLRVERGESLVTAPRARVLEDFQQSLARAPNLRTLVDGLAGGADVSGFDLSVLSEEERSRLRVAIKATSSLDNVNSSNQTTGNYLRSIGEVAGLDVVAASVTRSGQRAPRGTGQLIADIIPGAARWRPPAHVNPAGRGLRLPTQVIVWHGAPVPQILEMVNRSAGMPAMVVSTTPLSAERRRQLERETRRVGASFLFIDAYVLTQAMVASVRDGVSPLDVVVATSLAMGRTNPYTAAGAVHPEMFMGRESELRSVRDFGGATTVFGGRQLGKSALLRQIERDLNEPAADGRPAVIRAHYLDLKREGIGSHLSAEKIWPVLAQSLERAGLASFGGQKDIASVSQAIRDYVTQPRQELRLFLDEADDFLQAESRSGFPNLSWFKDLLESNQNSFKMVFAGLHSVNRFRRIPNQPLAQLGVPERIGPLKWNEARDLVLTPLEALGYRFEDAGLVDVILVETRRHPNLIQFACKSLVDQVSARASAKDESAPLAITAADLDAIFERDDFREWLRERFELTLNLYRHYKVLALILAMEAHEREEVRLEGLSLQALERLAKDWWPEGFGDMTPDEFSVVVEEMENLEVLALNKATGRYRLPSVNLIRLLGGSEEIERHLIAELDLPAERPDDGAQHDRRRIEDRHSALTFDDERLLLAEGHRPVTLLFGNSALAVEGVAADLERAVTHPGWNRGVTVRTINVGDRPPPFAPGTVFVGQVRCTPRASEYVSNWLTEIAQTEVDEDRRVVLIFDQKWLPRWLEIIDYVELEDKAQVLVLKRWNPGAFRRWLEELGAAADRADLWFGATGGFPAAVGTLTPRRVEEGDPKDLSQFVDTLVPNLGLGELQPVRAVFRTVVECGAATSVVELAELTGDAPLVDVAAACELLAMLGLLRRTPEGFMPGHAAAGELAAAL
jgi:hypothetical protein